MQQSLNRKERKKSLRHLLKNALGSKVVFILSIVYVLTFSLIAEAGIIFQDNFDNQPDWTRPQPVKPTNDVCYSGSCDVPIGWSGYYNGGSFCNGGPGNNTLNLNSSKPRGGSGKSLIFWDESCTDNYEDSDGDLLKDLGGTYQELYIRFYIKFANNYQWKKVGMGPHKIVRLWHYRGSGTPYEFFNKGNQPIWLGIVKSENATYLYYSSLYRCEVDYYCQGTPSYKFDVGKDQDHVRLGVISTSIADGSWHSLEFYVKMNTNNGTSFNADGVQRTWIDGTLIYESTNIPFSDNGSVVSPRNGFNLVAIGGNNNNRWTTDCSGTGCEQWYAIDDFVISTNYIGPNPITTDDIAPAPPQGVSAQ